MRIINSLRREFKLKDLLSYTGMAKATYMYWQKRFNRENPDQDLEEKIQKIQEKNKNYGYRRIFGELRKQGLVVNKKKVQRIMEIERYIKYYNEQRIKEKLGWMSPVEYRLTHLAA